MKKVLIFSLTYYPNQVSGAEVAIKEITDRIHDVEFHVVTLLFNPKQSRTEKIGNTYVHRVGFGGAYLSKVLFVPLAAIKARSLERIIGIDAVWCMMTYMLFPLVLARVLGLRAPHMLSLQDGDPYEKVFRRWFVLPLAPLLDYGFRSAKIVQVISSYLAQWPQKRGYTGPVELVPNGASPASERDYSAEELAELKRQVGKKDADIQLVSVSRLAHQKAIDVVLRALALLPKNVRYLVVGDGPERERLKKLAQELGVADRVVFTGYVDRTMTAKYRKISDIFITPSRSEGQGIAFLSAFAAGLPVIATQEGGIADFLFDAQRNPDKPTTGWAVDADSPEQIVAAVQDILAHPEQVQTVTATAKRMVAEQYNWDVIVQRMRAVFDHVL